jgi:hypothetical protein
MSCSCQGSGAQLCGCCSGVTRLTPALIVNRSLLPAISYRVGTYSSFLQTMLAALSSSNEPALAGLRTRDNSDFSIALVDAWSEVLDILTFYTERLANEAYLGTAVEARSVFELVKLIGYKPSPGVSASTVLAFTLTSSPGSPPVVPIPAGTRVQSVPGPGQAPQVFETSPDLTATIAGNAIPAATTQPWQLSGGDTSTWIAGTSNNIQPGNVLLFMSAPGGVPSPTTANAGCYVTAVQPDTSSGNTQIFWDAPLPSAFAAGDSAVCIYVFRTKAALYGATAPRPGIFAPSTTTSTTDSSSNTTTASSTISPQIAGYPSGTVTGDSDWAWVYTDGTDSISLDSSVPGLNPMASGTTAPAAQSQWMLLTGPQYTSVFQIESAVDTNPALYSLSTKTTQLTLASGTVMIGDTSLTLNELLYEFVQETRVTTAYVGSQLLALANLPVTQWSESGSYPLASGMLAPVSGTSLTIVGLQPLALNTPVGISGKRVRIAPADPSASFIPSGAVAGLTVSANQAFLIDAFPPTTDSAGNLFWSVLTVNGQAGVLSVAPGAFVLQPSSSADPVTGEAATVNAAQINGATTALTFGADLARIYDASTVAVNTNAVLATHGQTTQEILGSGDATNPALQFQLKQSPVTYLSAANASGVQSTLQVRVNNLLWTEAANFLASAPADRAYITIPNSTGGPTVEFGNGIQGSRTPTGQANIQALYRVGIGAAGMVSPGQLTQALDRPQGLQSVTNPSAATGGADPATPAQARASAPLPTLTLSRVVSLEDYQNFALNTPGISLALATWTWLGTTRSIFLTVAGANGATFQPTDQIVENLLSSFQTYGLPYVPVQIVSYVQVLFEINLQVLVNAPLYDPNLVLPQVWQALSAAFVFGQLAPGQGVAASQIIAVAQQVTGVIAVNLTALCRKGDTPGMNNYLSASGPQPTATPPTGAEVLAIDPASQGNVAVWS